jgi:acetolactate synthase-1/2/3 large subunit
MASDYTVGDLVAEFLTACGVTTAFGIASVHNIPMLDAIGRRNTIRFMMARGELGGAHMADGYARVSGGLGVLFSSTGPGAANAIGGLIEARFSGSPVLHITGMTMSKYADRDMGTVHDPLDQLGMMRSVCKAAYRVRSANQALGVLTRRRRR